MTTQSAVREVTFSHIHRLVAEVTVHGLSALTIHAHSQPDDTAEAWGSASCPGIHLHVSCTGLGSKQLSYSWMTTLPLSHSRPMYYYITFFDSIFCIKC